MANKLSLRLSRTTQFSPTVEYFNHCLDAVHSKHWQKYAFSTFLVKNEEKEEKAGKQMLNLAKKN